VLGDFVIGVGSNLGAREAHVCQGLSALSALVGVEITALSCLYESEAWGPPQPRYLNAAARVASALSPPELLDRLLAVELASGRTRTLRYGPRTLDLDILWGVPWDSAALVVPHPRLRERTFALAPLLDVAPELRGELGPVLASLGGAPARVGRLVHGADASERCVQLDATPAV
jgi:2-amino-4-hydroxy-6-hydroxymethyldihydropteridine diphosphokinase